MRFVLLLLICHQAGHDSNLAHAVIDAGASLQRVIFSNQSCCWERAIAKNVLEWFHSDTVCAGICAPAVCLQASWVCWHVFPVICHLCLRAAMAVTAVLSVSAGERGEWQHSLHWQLGKRWGRTGLWPGLALGFLLYPSSASAPRRRRLPGPPVPRSLFEMFSWLQWLPPGRTVAELYLVADGVFYPKLVVLTLAKFLARWCPKEQGWKVGSLKTVALGLTWLLMSCASDRGWFSLPIRSDRIKEGDKVCTWNDHIIKIDYLLYILGSFEAAK